MFSCPTFCKNSCSFVIFFLSSFCLSAFSFEENNTFSEIEVSTEQTDCLMDFQLESLLCKIIMISEPLKECLSKIEGSSDSAIEIQVVPYCYVRFTTSDSSGGTVQVGTTYYVDIIL